MRAVKILDCTLRDGGYINDWMFGKTAIEYILKKLSVAGIDYIEVGFIKGNRFDENRTVYPDVDHISAAIPSKNDGIIYVGMVDMSAPVPLECIPERKPEFIDAIRVIFKQDKIEEGYRYAKEIKNRGYLTMIQLVSTDTYTDEELVAVVKRFNELDPHAVYIVDSLGLIKRKQFMRMVYLMDNNMKPDVILGYHSHNNLQQARGNAEAMVELSLTRDILIDASVYGMGRGAGNLNEELFADYLNENYGTNYHIEPMLEIIDEYLNDIYKESFWGYSLPFYLSASNGVHPNYAKYYNEKGTLTEKAFNELLKTIEEKDRHIFSKELAEKYYGKYMENYVDDRNDIRKLSREINSKNLVIIAPGNSVMNKEINLQDYVSDSDFVISIGFVPTEVKPNYVFCSNLRKYEKVKDYDVKKIVTSNIKVAEDYTYRMNYSSYLSKNPAIVDNAGIMLLKILRDAEIHSVSIVGMDGYSGNNKYNIYRDVYETNESLYSQIDNAMRDEIVAFGNQMTVKFLTKSAYERGNK